MSLLRFPEPYDFALSTGRFRAFGTDLANRLEGDVLHRAVAVISPHSQSTRYRSTDSTS